MASMNLHLLAVVMLAACVPPSPPPPPPTDAELLDQCDGDLSEDRMPDHGACWTLGRREVESGRGEAGARHLNIACIDHPAACTDLALLYLEGNLIRRDLKEGFGQASVGCMPGKADGDACGWEGVGYLHRYNGTPVARNVLDRALHRTCEQSPDAGWACYNYAVAVSCGLLGPPDFAMAKQVAERACQLNDVRGCELRGQFEVAPKPPACTLIGTDPDHPIDISMNLEPLAPGATLPPDMKPFVRRRFRDIR